MPQPKKPASSPAPTAVPNTSEELAANLGVLRERLIHSLTLTTDRLQDTVDDTVRRGRMTRRDAEDLLTTIVSMGRAQTEQLVADLEALLARGPGGGGAVRRSVVRARRAVSAATFPIADYDALTAAQIVAGLDGLTAAELRRVADHERAHAARKTVLRAVDRRLS